MQKRRTARGALLVATTPLNLPLNLPRRGMWWRWWLNRSWLCTG